MPDHIRHTLRRLALTVAALLPALAAAAQDADAITFITVKGSISSINCFMQDTHGQIWVGSQEGMLVSDGVTCARHGGNINHQMGREIVNSIYNAGNNTYYLGTSNGVYRMNLEKDSYSLVYETAAIDVRHIFRHDDDNMLLGTSHGLLRHRLSSEEVSAVSALDDSPVRGIVKVNDLTAVANSQGVTCIDQHCRKVDAVDCSVPATAIHYDFRGRRLLVGTRQGLLSYDMSQQRPAASTVLGGKNITSVYVDSHDGLWVGTTDGVYHRSDGSGTFQAYRQNPIDRYSLTCNAATCFYEDQGTNIWIGTRQGVSLYHRGKPIVSHTFADASGSALGITSTAMLHDSAGRLWVGTHEGLYMRQGADGSPTQSVAAARLGGSYIRDIMEDRDGSVWICTDQGVCRYLGSGDVTALYTVTDSVGTESDAVYSMVQTQSGTYAIGTVNSGIYFVAHDDLHHPSRQGTIHAYYRKDWGERSQIYPDTRIPKMAAYGRDAVMSLSDIVQLTSENVEGPCAFALVDGSGYGVIWDYYNIHAGYGLSVTDDFVAWTRLTNPRPPLYNDSVRFPTAARHGCIMPITRSEREGLANKR